MVDLTMVDGLLAGVLLLSLVLGAWRGLVQELMSLGSWVLAFVLARWLAVDVAQWLPWWREAAVQARYALAFVLVFVLGLLLGGLLSWLMRRTVEVVGLRPLDRLLGALFGALRGVLVLMLLAVVVHQLGLRTQPWWLQSQAAPWLETLLRGIKPLLPVHLQPFLP